MQNATGYCTNSCKIYKNGLPKCISAGQKKLKSAVSAHYHLDG